VDRLVQSFSYGERSSSKASSYRHYVRFRLQVLLTFIWSKDSPQAHPLCTVDITERHCLMRVVAFSAISSPSFSISKAGHVWHAQGWMTGGGYSTSRPAVSSAGLAKITGLKSLMIVM
jgi:hypothetical protein